MPHTEIQTLLDSATAQNGGMLSFREFMQISLFAPGCGYYTSARKRVGKAAGTDFYTAASAGGKMFGELICAAAESLAGGDARAFTLTEIGAEPGQSHFSAESIRARFAGVKTIRVGEKIEIPENAIVVANELFDAQPCSRLIFKNGAWREIGVVRSRASGEWAETILPEISSETLREFIARELPAHIDEDWRLDISIDAENLLHEILSANQWRGAFIFLDYGKTLADCLDAFPGGTARAYFRHTQTSALTANPGEQDLTCHVMWDRLKKIARECGFRDAEVLRQEAFFMKFSLETIRKIIDSGTLQHTENEIRERTKLLELIHPGNMGHVFQVLAGRRL